MTAALVAALIAAMALLGGLSAVLFWQLKRAASAMDKVLGLTQEQAEARVLRAASDVALADKERAMNLLIAERDRLLSTIQTIEDQRDELLKEAFKRATPGSAAIAVRDALKRLQAVSPVPKAEGVPDVPSGSDDNGN